MKAKAMKAASSSTKLTKGAMVKDIAAEHELKSKEVSQIFDSLAAIATKEVKKTGVFTIPGLCRIKTRTKPATKAGVRMAFGQEIKVKAKPARTIVKAFPVVHYPWESHGLGLGGACLSPGQYNFAHCTF